MLQSVTYFVLHSFTAATVVGSLYYDENYVGVTGREGMTNFGKKWKYLTHINLYIQAIYWTLVVLAGLTDGAYYNKLRRGSLSKCVDFIHSTLAFPIGTFVCVTFWMIYAVDRELVYPKRLDSIIPLWLNHVMHTVHLPFLALDKFMVCHRYPKQSMGLTALLTFATIYQAWILYLAFAKEIWVYPILAIMTWPYRLAFFALLWCFLTLLYMTGAALSKWLWRKSYSNQALRSKKIN